MCQPFLAIWQTWFKTSNSSSSFAIPCIRCDKTTVKLSTCSIEQAKEAFSAWSEVELEQAINTLSTVLESERSARWRRGMPN
jgi:hypothetical protein